MYKNNNSKKQSAIANPLASKKLANVRRDMMLWLDSNYSKIPTPAYNKYADKIENGQRKTITELYENVNILLSSGKKPTLKTLKAKKEEIKKENEQQQEYIIAMMNRDDDMYEHFAAPKITFSDKDIVISSKQFKHVAEAMEIEINEHVETSDLTLFMKKMSKIVVNQLKHFYSKYGSYKIVFQLDVKMFSNKLNTTHTIPFSSGSVNNNENKNTGTAILNINNLNNVFHTAMAKIIQIVEDFQKLTSDFVVEGVEKMYMKVAKYVPGAGSSYIDLPERIKNKKCCINIQNDDDKCFEYSVLCGLYQDEIKRDFQRVTKYKPYEDVLKFDDIQFPVSVDDVALFEKLNEQPINIFGLNKDEDPIILHNHTFKCEKKIINLLLIENEEKSHYVLVKSLNALFTKDKCNNFICDKCLSRHSRLEALDNHIKINKCIEYNGVAIQSLPSTKDNKHQVKFTNIKKQLRVPFVIYADGESMLKAVEKSEKSDSKTEIYQNHVYRHIGSNLTSDFPKMVSAEYKQFDGEDCVINFLNYCMDTYEKCAEVLKDETHKILDLEKFSKKDLLDIKNATHCHICEKVLKDERHTDHCHITGAYRGMTHPGCNLKYNYKGFKLPIIMHNLKGYDSHFLMQYAGQMTNKKGESLKYSVIPTTMEKYLSFTIENCVFLDSAQFMADSLENLVDALNTVHEKTKDDNIFSNFHSGFQQTSSSLRKNLRQKGVFPYDWFDSVEKLDATELPSKEHFYNKLNDCNISDADYNRACEIYKKSGCKTFYDYMSLYLKTDVLLLADVFENFRSMCLTYYKLDPCHYYTAPGFSWDAMMKMTDITIDCFSEGQEDMLNMVKAGMRGGMSQISHRYATANNKYMKSFNPTKDSSYIIYLDANNLYGWAMSQYLPTGEYSWWLNKNSDGRYIMQDDLCMRIKDNLIDPIIKTDTFDEPFVHSFADFNSISLKKVEDVFMKMTPNRDYGYILEVDLEVPEALHDYFNDYPLAPESCLGEYSPLMKDIMLKYDINESVQVKKLIPNLNNKTKYVLHYRNLQLYLSLGMKLTKIHRVISFKQSSYLKTYIDFNTKKRAASKNDFEKNLFKLFNNSIFGKTCENVEKHIDCKIYAKESLFMRAVAQPNFKNFKIFSDGLVAVEMNKTEIKYNKPMIVGCCILELSKVLMYDFHYQTVVKTYGDKAKLLFTDTDSLCYHIKTDDIYKDMETNKDAYDFSDYPKEHFLYNEDHKKEIGIFKCETSGVPIVEFCALRSKMYGFRTENDKTKAVAKGIKKNQIKKLTIQKYKDALFGNTKEQLQQQVSFNLIRQNAHQVNSVTITKTGLCGMDDKRYVCKDNINTLSHGHWKTKSGDY